MDSLLLYDKKKYITKQIIVFLNGNVNHPGKKIMITSTKKRKWHHILNDITKKLNPNFGYVKNLYTSESGISLNSFTDLKNNGEYVASDSRKFQPVKGGYKTEDKKRKVKYMEHYNSGQLIYVNNLTKLSKVRRNLVVIFVYINGKCRDLFQKFVLTDEDLKNWQQCLSYIASVLDMPCRNIKFLYDTDGSKICGPWELQHGGIYIAVGYNEKFIKRDYNTWLDTMENMKKDIPVIKKDKNIPCFHKNKLVKSWEKNINWRTYLKNGFIDCSIYDSSGMFQNDKFFFKDLPKVNKYTCKCLYYKATDEGTVLTTDNTYEEEYLDNTNTTTISNNKEDVGTRSRKYCSDSVVDYNRSNCCTKDSCPCQVDSE